MWTPSNLKRIAKQALGRYRDPAQYFSVRGDGVRLKFCLVSGQSYFCDPRGQIIATASRDRDEVLNAYLDLEKITEVRRTWQFFRDRRPDAYADLVKP